MVRSLYAIALNKIFTEFGEALRDECNPEIHKLRIILNSNHRMIHYLDGDCHNQLHAKTARTI